MEIKKIKLKKIHNFSNIIERNNTVLFNLQSSISEETTSNYKVISSKYTTTTKGIDIESIQNSIITLKNDNMELVNKIKKLKKDEIDSTNEKMKKLKQVGPQKRYIKQRLFKINNNLQFFLHLIKNRKSIIRLNTALQLKQVESSTRKTYYIKEYNKLYLVVIM